VSKQLAADLVASFDALFGDNPGFRAAHAKGVCCDAIFTATPEAAALTRAPHMQGAPVRATVRFSNGSGDPTAKDFGREPRGMALKFHLDERRSTDIVTINQPVFVTRTPEDLLEFMELRKPDPATGKLDIEALMAFVAAHPESQRGAELLVGSPPFVSYLQIEYFAIHAFGFVAADGTARFGRYRFEPAAGVATLEVAEAKQRPRDYLSDELLERLSQGPGRFTLHIQLAGEGDDPTDPTVEWPAERPSIVAGHIEITGPSADQEACEPFVFDPTRLCDGIEESGDPILSIRSRAYAVSSQRRAKARRA
jgi:catalase